MDNFYEQIVKRKNPGFVRTSFYTLSSLSVLFGIGTVFIQPLFFGLPFIVLCVMTFITYNNMNIDFEYTYTNGDIDVAKVIGNNKRKKIVSISMADLVVMAPYGTDPIKPYLQTKLKTYDCTSLEEGTKQYTLVAKNGNGNYKLIFEPCEEIVTDMKRRNPRNIFVD